MVGRQERPQKPNQLKEQKVKSLEFFKATLATALAIVFACLLSVRPAQAGGYTVTLQQVGPDVVATGSGALDLTGLTRESSSVLPEPNHSMISSPWIVTGATGGPRDLYEVAPMALGAAAALERLPTARAATLSGCL
jgi:hypothetical protein